MNCREIEPLLYLVREGELTKQERAIVDEHLSGCESCSRLSESIRQMEMLIRTDISSTVVSDDKVILSVEAAVNLPFRTSYLIVMQRLAAAILFILATLFGYQEISFNRNRQALEARLQISREKSGNETDMSDCIEKLVKQYHYKYRGLFNNKDIRSFNLISDEELNRYIRQVCNSGKGDPAELRKLMNAAGLDQTILSNDVKN